MPIAKPASKILGSLDNASHQKQVNLLIERREFFLGQCAEYWQSSVRFMKLYLSKREDYRTDPRDQWMANVFVPDPLKITETKAAVETEIIHSADPPIQPESVGDEDYDNSRAVERLLDYALRKNRFRKFGSNMSRMKSIKGTQFYSLGWIDDVIDVEFDAEPGEREEFEKRLTGVFEGMEIQDPSQVPDWMTDPEKFEMFRKEARHRGTDVPELPALQKKIVRYRGPKWELVELTDVLLDPLIGELEDQPLVMRRLLKRASWLRNKTGPDGPYDGKIVEACIQSAGDLKLSSEEHEINSFLGIPSGPDDPAIVDSGDPLCELIEFWQPGQDVEHGVMVNRKGIVNKSLANPFKHGRVSLGCVRNIIVPGRQFGLSDYQAPEALFEEQNILRSLRINRTILETFPIFTRLIEMGMPDLQERMVPNGIIPVSRESALKPLIEYRPTNAFRDLQVLSQNIDNASGIGSNVAGGPAEVGRVSATDASGRMQQAQVRLKLGAVVTEEELVPSVEQMLWLFAERGGPELRVRIGGKDPFLKVDRSQLLEALEMDYRFIGATRALKKDIQVQQLMDYLDKNQGKLIPPEHRQLMRLIADTLAVKGISRVISETGDAFAKQQFQLMQVESQIKLLALQKKLTEIQSPPVPPVVTPEVAGQLVEGQGGSDVGPGAAPAGPAGAPGLPGASPTGPVI